MGRFFILPSIISVIALAAVFWYAGIAAFLTAAVLSVLEVTLSFDNAVVNAKVLKDMSREWQRRFMTWGVLIAVFGTRLVLPVLIISATVFISPIEVLRIAFFDPARYGELLLGAHYAINGFGAAFLMMVSLKYFLDNGKRVHWIHAIESRLARWGRIEALEIAIALAVTFVIALLIPPAAEATTLLAGITGILLFIVMQGITTSFSQRARGAVAHGLSLFIYLNILDSAFSLDSVVGAFALTSSILVIVVGLGIGAYFVRSLTVYLVEHKTLDSLAYLEHGAHWAIFGLAACMFADLIVQVPEFVTGSIGLLFVLAAYWSSVKSTPRAA